MVNIVRDMKNFIITIMIVVLLYAIAHADELCFLSLDKDKIAPGKQAILSVIVPGASDIPAPELPFVNGLAFKYQRTEKKPIDLSRKTTLSAVHMYRVVAMKEGTYTIGPLSFDHRGKRYSSGTVILSVSKEFIQTEESSSQERGPVSLQGHIYVVLDKSSDKILVNQKTPMSIKLFSDWFDLEDITLSDISNPDLIIEKFQKGPSAIIVKDGIRYAILEYKGSLLAPAPGVFTLEPVKISLSIARRRALPSGKMPGLLNDNESFYDRVLGQRDTLPIDLMTGPATIEVVDLPREGRPEDFKGAIGSFDLNVEANPIALKEGDVLMLKVVITGSGNFNTVTSLDIPKIAGFKYFEPVITRSETAFTLEQAMRLIGPGAGEVPKITFSFFDPAQGKYVSLSSGPIPLSIGPFKKEAESPKGASGTLKGEERPAGEELVSIKKAIGPARRKPFYNGNPLFSSWVILPLIFLGIAALIKKRLDFLRENAEYARWLRALRRSSADTAKLERFARSASPKEFYDAVFEVMCGYLGLRLFLPPQGITEKTIIDLLGDKIEDGSIIDMINDIFADCHAARFTPLQMGKDDIARTLSEAKKVMEYLNQRTYLLNI